MNYFVLLISLFAILIGFLASLTLFFGRNTNFSFRILAFWILCLITLLIFTNLLEWKRLYDYILLFRIPSLLIYLVGPLSYLFIRSLLHNETKFRKWDWLHAVPFLLHLIELTPFFLSPHIIGSIEIDAFFKSYQLSLVSEGYLPKQVHVLLKFISIIAYSIACAYVYLNEIKDKKIGKTHNDYLIFRFVKVLVILKIFNGICIVTFTILLLKKIINGIVVVEFINGLTLIYITSYLYYHPIILYGLKKSTSNSLLLSKIKMISKKLQSSLFSATEAILFLDPNFIVLHFNLLAGHQFQTKFQKTLNIGVNYSNYLEDATAVVFKENFQKAVNGQKITMQLENSSSDSIDKNWIELNFIPVYDDAKNLLGISVLTIDINETKLAEEDNFEYALRLKEITWRQSHLIRAPIANLLGITKLLNKPNSTINDAEKLVLIAQLENEVKRLDDEINGLFTQPIN